MFYLPSILPFEFLIENWRVKNVQRIPIYWRLLRTLLTYKPSISAGSGDKSFLCGSQFHYDQNDNSQLGSKWRAKASKTFHWDYIYLSCDHQVLAVFKCSDGLSGIFTFNTISATFLQHVTKYISPQMLTINIIYVIIKSYEGSSSRIFLFTFHKNW